VRLRGRPTVGAHARKLQHSRLRVSKLACNADMGPAEVRQFYELDEVSRSLLRSAGTRPAPCERALRARPETGHRA